MLPRNRSLGPFHPRSHSRRLRAPASSPLFGEAPALPPALRRRLDEHRKRVELQRSILDRRASFEEPLVEPLGVLLRVPASLVEEGR